MYCTCSFLPLLYVLKWVCLFVIFPCLCCIFCWFIFYSLKSYKTSGSIRIDVHISFNVYYFLVLVSNLFVFVQLNTHALLIAHNCRVFVIMKMKKKYIFKILLHMHFCLLKMNKKMNNISVKISSLLWFDYALQTHSLHMFKVFSVYKYVGNWHLQRTHLPLFFFDLAKVSLPVRVASEKEKQQQTR